MPKQYPKEQRDRAVRIGSESLRRWTQQAQVDAGTRDGPTSEELAEIKELKSKVHDLEEAIRHYVNPTTCELKSPQRHNQSRFEAGAAARHQCDQPPHRGRLLAPARMGGQGITSRVNRHRPRHNSRPTTPTTPKPLWPVSSRESSRGWAPTNCREPTTTIPCPRAVTSP